MNTEGKLAVARIVLSVCGAKGYQLSGSLALHAYGVTGALPADGIDVFTDRILDGLAVRTAVYDALRAHGYRVEEARTWAFHPLAKCDQNSDLSVSHPAHGTVTVRMARMPRYFEPQLIDGMPVAALGDLLYARLEVPEHRLTVKVFLELALLASYLGRAAVDSYITDYVRGIAGVRQVAETRVRETLHVLLAQAADILDGAFAGYGLDPEEVAQLRVDLLEWADRIVPSEAPEQYPGPRVSFGLEGVSEVVASLARLARAGSLALMSTADLSTLRGQVVGRALTASRGVRQLTDQSPEAAPFSAKVAEALNRAGELLEEVLRITLEIQRRAKLSARQRAAEEAIRRAAAGDTDVGEPAEPGQAPARAATRRRRHTEAEEELQHHRPATGPGYGGVRV